LRREESAGTSVQSLERRLPNRELVTVKTVAYGILWGRHPFVKKYLCYDKNVRKKGNAHQEDSTGKTGNAQSYRVFGRVLSILHSCPCTFQK
jgi:hypothetical protein